MQLKDSFLYVVICCVMLSVASCSPDTSIEDYIGEDLYGKYQWTLFVELSHPNDTLYSEQTEGFSAEVEIAKVGD